jgi:tryptophan-rich sensory protein
VPEVPPAEVGRAPWRVWAVTLAAIVAMSLAGQLATDIGPWYRALVKPAWQPPDAAFGPAWTTIYACAAWACVRLWQRGDAAWRRRWLWAVGVNAVLNVLWSALFFSLRRPDWALVQVAVLWLSIAWLVRLAWPLDRPAAALLAPYLGWVAFAAVLNGAIVRLNGPFA